MRVNVYAEEMTERIEIVRKRTADGEFTGVRFYLELPISVPAAGGHMITHRGPFIHHPGDDDSSAVTFWGKTDLRKVLYKALAMLDKHYEPKAEALTNAKSEAPAVCGHGNYARSCPQRSAIQIERGSPCQV